MRRRPVVSCIVRTFGRTLGLQTIALVAVFVGLLANPSLGGLSPAETVVVVNGNSFNSRTLANHFIYLRGIPAQNVIVLRDVPNSEEIDVATFRQRILRPLLEELDRRQLSATVQCIAYSADFPTAIDITADLAPLGDLPQPFTRKASINALTYLFALARDGAPNYILPKINFYARRHIEAYFSNPGGDATRQQWESIQSAIAAGEHESAATELESIFKTQPHQFPMAYLAAAELALANRSEDAIRWLGIAIERGWIAGGYLSRDERFENLRGNPEFEVLKLLLDPAIDSRQWPEGFDSQTAWSPNGVPVRAATPAETRKLATEFGMPFMLSTVLGVTRGNGLRLPEAVRSLERSANADFTYPDGQFVFSETNDIRTTVRAPDYYAAVEALQQMGFKASIQRHHIPETTGPLLGIQMGTPHFDWRPLAGLLAPGALADNLTSAGGIMGPNVAQTNLTALIRAGAAGSSGTVVEPFAIPDKFPSPFMYVYYAQGASLAESFYLSVNGPYQLLIVGDPLCRPFSHAPRVTFTRETEAESAEIEPGDDVKLQFDLSGPSYSRWEEVEDKPLADRRERLAPARFKILLDGRLIHAGKVVKQLTLNTDGLDRGHHRIDVVAIADDPLKQKDSAAMAIWLGEPNLCHMEFPDEHQSASDGQPVQEKRSSSDDPDDEASQTTPRESTQRPTFDASFSLQNDMSLEVTVFGPESSQRVGLWQDHEQLSVAESSNANFEIPIHEFGLGPIRLQPKCELESGEVIAGRPYWIEIKP